MIRFEKKNVFTKIRAITMAIGLEKIVDIFFLKLEPSSFPMMYRYCF